MLKCNECVNGKCSSKDAKIKSLEYKHCLDFKYDRGLKIPFILKLDNSSITNLMYSLDSLGLKFDINMNT